MGPLCEGRIRFKGKHSFVYLSVLHGSVQFRQVTRISQLSMLTRLLGTLAAKRVMPVAGPSLCDYSILHTGI